MGLLGFVAPEEAVGDVEVEFVVGIKTLELRVSERCGIWGRRRKGPINNVDDTIGGEEIGFHDFGFVDEDGVVDDGYFDGFAVEGRNGGAVFELGAIVDFVGLLDC